METTMKTASCLLAFVLTLGVASAQSLDSIVAVDGPDPGGDSGLIGNTVTIAGSGFGGSTGLLQPKAYFRDPATLKTYALKITAFTDIEITATISKAVYGTLDLEVQPKDTAVLVLEDAFTFAAPQVTLVTPDEATLGATLTIEGSGLGGLKGNGKPKVFLQDPATLKKYTLKVLTVSDTAVTALISKAVAGDLDLHVQPKGAADILADDEFTVPSPVIDAISPEHAFALETITLTGTHFGALKPKLTVGGKTVKPLTFSDTEVTFPMPTALAKGVHTVVLTTKVGVATLPHALIMKGAAADTLTTDLMTAKLGKTTFTASSSFVGVFTIYDDGPPPDIACDGSTLGTFGVVAQTGITLHIPFDPNTFTEPVAFVDEPGTSIAYQINALELFAPPQAVWSSDAEGGSCAIVILDIVPVEGGVLMRGAFAGTLKLVSGTGAQTLVATGGEFRSTFTP
jgi:hypothetical protein